MDFHHIIAYLLVAVLLLSPLGALTGGWWWFTRGRARYPVAQWGGFTIVCTLLAVVSTVAEVVLGINAMGLGRVFLVGTALGLFGIAVRKVLPVEGGRRSFVLAGGLLAVGVLMLVLSESLVSGIGRGSMFQTQERLGGQDCLLNGEREDITFLLFAMLLMSVAFVGDMVSRKRAKLALGGLAFLAAVGIAMLVTTAYSPCGPRDVSSTTASYSPI